MAKQKRKDEPVPGPQASGPASTGKRLFRPRFAMPRLALPRPRFVWRGRRALVVLGGSFALALFGGWLGTVGGCLLDAQEDATLWYLTGALAGGLVGMLGGGLVMVRKAPGS